MEVARHSSPGQYLASLPAGRYVHVSSLPGSANAAKTAASRAASRGEIVPLRRGLYYKGVPTRYGMATPPKEDVALEVLGRIGVGPAGVSAARAFNLTTQVPVKPELATASPVPTNVSGVRIHKRNNMARRELTYHEIALLEVLRDYRFTSESSWDALVAAVAERVKDRKVRPAKVVEAARGERKPRVTSAVAKVIADLPDYLDHRTIDAREPRRRNRRALAAADATG
jgi:hypothetical protein